MVHHQHIGPIGQYRIPENSRFRWDATKYKMVSVIPGIEILETEAGGRETPFYNAKIRIGEQLYWLWVNIESERDKWGNQIFNYADGKKKPSDTVFTNAHMTKIEKKDGTTIRTGNVSYSRFSDEITQIVLDFLSLRRTSEIARIIFSDQEQISPKNYEVISND